MRVPVEEPTPAATLDSVRDLLPAVVARVGDWVLDRATVWRQIQAKVKRVLAAEGVVPVTLLRYLARPIVNQAIEERLLGPVAEAEGFPPDMARASAHLERMLADPNARRELGQFLDENGLDRKEYLWRLALRTAITDWVRHRFVDPQAVSEEELRESYETRKAELAAPETIDLQRILVPRSPDVPKDADPGKALAQRLRDAVGSGTPFPDAVDKLCGALTHGQGTPLARYEEERTPLSRLPDAVREVVQGLNAGAVSEIIPLPDAYALVRWTERISPRQRAFEEVKEGLRLNLKEEKGRAAFTAFLNDLRSKSAVVIYPPLEDPKTPWPREPEVPGISPRTGP